ncbi:ATPase inhibitor [Clarireedia jacksonii]
MYRTALTSLRPALRSTFSPAATRAFSVSARTMAGGDTGASRPGGVAQGYVFSLFCLLSYDSSRKGFGTAYNERAIAGTEWGNLSNSSACMHTCLWENDAFTKREKANEDYNIRMREKEKLLELKKKLQEQHEHLKKLEDHISEIEKQSGGEQK